MQQRYEIDSITPRKSCVWLTKIVFAFNTMTILYEGTLLHRLYEQESRMIEAQHDHIAHISRNVINLSLYSGNKTQIQLRFERYKFISDGSSNTVFRFDSVAIRLSVLVGAVGNRNGTFVDDLVGDDLTAGHCIVDGTRSEAVELVLDAAESTIDRSGNPAASTRRRSGRGDRVVASNRNRTSLEQLWPWKSTSSTDGIGHSSPRWSRPRTDDPTHHQRHQSQTNAHSEGKKRTAVCSR